jgi:hypothetical protein
MEGLKEGRQHLQQPQYSGCPGKDEKSLKIFWTLGRVNGLYRRC